jgi:uncharacterized protein with GYD domain
MSALTLNACILIKTTPTQSEKVKDAASKLASVTKAFLSYGRYDLVVFVKSDDYAAIRQLTTTINALDGVRSTETLVEA